MADYRYAEKGKLFVVTEKGYEATPDKVKYERTVGQPIQGLEGRVPESWIEKGYVQQVDAKEVYIPFTHEGKEHYLYITNSRWPGTLNFDILSDSYTPIMADMSCTVDPASMSVGNITGADGETLMDEGLWAAIEGAVGKYTGRHPEIGEVWKAAKRLDRVYFEQPDYGEYYVDIVAVRENGKQGEFRFAVTDADNGYMGIVGKTFTVDFDARKVEFPQSMILEDMQFPIQDAIIRSLNEHYPVLENRAYYEERLEQDKDPQPTKAHLSQEEEMAENMKGKILRMQDASEAMPAIEHPVKKLDRIYFEGGALPLKHYVDIFSMGEKDNKEEFLFAVVLAEDSKREVTRSEKCSIDLNTGEIEFPSYMDIDKLDRDIKSAVKKSIDQYYIEGSTKDRSISPEYFNPLQGPENPLDALQKIIEKNAPEEGPALEEIRKYMEEMNNNYKSMRSELQSLREQIEERSDNSDLGKKTVESLEKSTKSFKERIDGFKKNIFQKAADIIRNFKEKGTIALHNIVQKLGIKENIQSHMKYYKDQAEKFNRTVEKLDAINAEFNAAKGHIKNIGRAIIGKEALDPQQKENFLIKILKRPYVNDRDNYIKLTEQAIKRLDRLEALEAKAAEARLHQGEKGAKRDSTLQKLSDYKKEAASRDEAKKDAPDRENIKKDLEMAL